MSISIENVARTVVQIMRGSGLEIQTFNQALSPTVNATSARWFYSPSNGLMVHLTDDKTKPELKIMMSQGLDTSSIKDMYMSLRQLAKNYNLLPSVRIFGKHLEPKDFQAQAASTQMSESAFGTTKTSYHPMPSAKVVLRHSKSVTEEKPGARSRNIKQIYIDNNQGERFKFDVPYLTAARAMARHVSDGGAPYDEKGRQIYDMAVERQELRRAISFARKMDLMDGLDEEMGLALGRIDEIDHSLKRFHRHGGEIENYHTKAIELPEATRIKFTINQFDESLLPGLEAIERQRNRVAETLSAVAAIDVFERAVAHWDGMTKRVVLDEDIFAEKSQLDQFLDRSGLNDSYQLVMARRHHLAETHHRRMDAAIKLAKTKEQVPDNKYPMSLQEEAEYHFLSRINRLDV